jgi:peroxiredoxin
MIALLISTALFQSAPPLNDILTKTGKFPGVIVKAEMISPSVVPIEFRIAPGGKLMAIYPTSVQYNTPDQWIVWMPDRRQYSVEKSEGGSPLPAGFDMLWPGDDINQQTGPATSITFEKKLCFAYPCKTKSGQAFDLFVEQANLMPYGTRAKANGNTYELVYRSVTVKPISKKELEFVPPSDARLLKPGEPQPELIKSGAELASFSATDQSGKKHSLDSLLKNKKGLVLNFWFSSCTGCVAEMPYLVKLHPQLAKDNIGLVGINSIDNASITSRTSKKNKLPYPTLGGEGSKAITKQVSVMAYPVTVVIGKDRKVIDAILGFDEPRLNKAIDALKAN